MDVAQTPSRSPRSTGGRFVFGLLVVLAVGVAGYAVVVSSLNKFPPPVGANAAGLATLVLHATSAAVALLIGPFQFLPRIRARHRRLHRWMGRIYCLACLVGGVAGAALAWGTTSGPVARYGFGGLAILWLACTSLAWASAVSADFAKHRMWMIRSFALTLAAVTLRIYLPLSMVAGIPFETAYPIIAWIAWVPNLAVAEWWLRRTPRLRV